MTEAGLSPEVEQYYTHATDEGARLTRSADGRLEMLRTQELLRRYLPPAPARVLDVGGGTGVHAQWLVEDGYHVDLIDPVPRPPPRPWGGNPLRRVRRVPRERQVRHLRHQLTHPRPAAPDAAGHTLAQAVHTRRHWRKSSYSNDQGGNCVETARLDSAMAVRDSKNAPASAFTIPAAAWTGFLTTLHTPDNT